MNTGKLIFVESVINNRYRCSGCGIEVSESKNTAEIGGKLVCKVCGKTIAIRMVGVK